ncbi:hypothetical protein ACSDR0_44590 [Streptosporangium sp. G11]|uniref:hypothetical protein n=1 Tax=Streptosporangium sp. G11 TaxID=3436926 RepID=UPI003EBC405B
MSDPSSFETRIHAEGLRSIAAKEIKSATAGDNSPIDARAFQVGPESVLAAGQVEIARPIHRLQLPRAGNFLGRDKALRRFDHLLTDTAEHVVVSQVVSGMGGVGKSELVRCYAHKHRNRYQVAWWVTADSLTNLQQGFAELGTEIHPPIGLVGQTQEAARWALAWLRAHPGWLVVLDNVEDPTQVRPWLDELSAGHVVITTRRNATCIGPAPTPWSWTCWIRIWPPT